MRRVDVLLLLGALMGAIVGCRAPRGAVSVTSVGLTDACPNGSLVREGRCACREELSLVLGACVAPRVAATVCGPIALATPAGCLPPPPCEPGRARDLDTGLCLGLRDVRGLAGSLGVLVSEAGVLDCPDGAELAAAGIERGVEGPRLGCLPRTACPIGSRNVRGWCLPEHACPPGSILATSGACLHFVSKDRASSIPKIDVARWLRAAIGDDGGAGAPPLCERLLRSRGALGVVGSPSTMAVGLTLSFPDNDVSQLLADVTLATSTRDPSSATAELERVIAPMIETLRGLGGVADQGAAAITVECPFVASLRPTEREEGQIR